MDQHFFEKILGGLKMTDSVEVQMVRILVETGEALVRGDTAPLDAIQKALDKMSDATAVRAFILIGIGVLFEVSSASNQAGKLEGQLEGFERGWYRGNERGFDKGFLEAL